MKVGGLVYLWSTCGPMELGPAFSKVLTIKGGGHRPGGQKGGSGGRASCHRSRSFGSSYPRRKRREGRSESPGRRQEFQELRSLRDRAGLRTGSRPTAAPVGSALSDGWRAQHCRAAPDRRPRLKPEPDSVKPSDRRSLGLPGLDLPKFRPLTLQRRGH